jgi:L-ascorbate metabolism protein UlaG (beta-lactamase superfamily)
MSHFREGEVVELRWLGVAGIELNSAGETLLLDPFVSRIQLWRMLVGHICSDRGLVARHLPRANHVLISHAHFEHMLDVPEVMRRTQAAAYGSDNACRLLAALGVDTARTTPIATGDRLALGPWEISVLAGLHSSFLGRQWAMGRVGSKAGPPRSARDYRADCCFSFLLAAEGLRLLAWGSTETAKAPQADVLFVGAGTARSYLENLLLRVQPRLVVPLHWDDIFRPLSKPIRPMLAPPAWRWPPLRRMDLGDFESGVRRAWPSARVLVPEVLRRYCLDALLG